MSLKETSVHTDTEQDAGLPAVDENGVAGGEIDTGNDTAAEEDTAFPRGVDSGGVDSGGSDNPPPLCGCCGCEKDVIVKTNVYLDIGTFSECFKLVAEKSTTNNQRFWNPYTFQTYEEEHGWNGDNLDDPHVLRPAISLSHLSDIKICHAYVTKVSFTGLFVKGKEESEYGGCPEPCYGSADPVAICEENNACEIEEKIIYADIRDTQCGINFCSEFDKYLIKEDIWVKLNLSLRTSTKARLIDCDQHSSGTGACSAPEDSGAESPSSTSGSEPPEKASFTLPSTSILCELDDYGTLRGLVPFCDPGEKWVSSSDSRDIEFVKLEQKIPVGNDWEWVEIPIDENTGNAKVYLDDAVRYQASCKTKTLSLRTTYKQSCPGSGSESPTPPSPPPESSSSESLSGSTSSSLSGSTSSSLSGSTSSSLSGSTSSSSECCMDCTCIVTVYSPDYTSIGWSYTDTTICVDSSGKGQVTTGQTKIGEGVDCVVTAGSCLVLTWMTGSAISVEAKAGVGPGTVLRPNDWLPEIVVTVNDSAAHDLCTDMSIWVHVYTSKCR